MYHIFISHAWNYSDAYNTVVNWLNEAQEEGKLTWTNYSVPEHDPVDANNTKKLQAALDAQIKPASKVIVISGMYAAYSDWINYEIDQSVNYGKYIIAYVRGDRNAFRPRLLITPQSWSAGISTFDKRNY